MEFDLDFYPLIDYRTWILGDECRRAVNLRRLNLLNEDEIHLIEISSKYQDCRNDPGHGEHAVYSALKLLPYYPDAKREVVVPAAWVHDMGFYGENSDEWKRLVEANKGNLKTLDNEANRRPHQNRGIMIAGRIFQKLDFPNEKYHFEIADIIGDHDTRKLPATLNGRIVRTADLLWRTSYPHAQIYMADETPEHILSRFKEFCISDELQPHLGEIGIQIAKLEFANTMFFKFGREVSTKLLLPKYKRELEIIASFYKSD